MNFLSVQVSVPTEMQVMRRYRLARQLMLNITRFPLRQQAKQTLQQMLAQLWPEQVDWLL